MRGERETEDVLNKALDAETQPSKYPGMTYEQGVAGALRWVLEWEDDDPMEDT